MTEILIRDIDFKPHNIKSSNAKHAKITFKNGYGASIIDGNGYEFFYTTSEAPYEVAVLGIDGDIDYNSPLGESVYGRLTKQEAQEVLDNISELPIEEPRK